MTVTPSLSTARRAVSAIVDTLKSESGASQTGFLSRRIGKTDRKCEWRYGRNLSTPPLLPMFKLSAQLAIFAQARTIGSVSRRLKPLTIDVDRVTTQNASSAAAQSTANTSTGRARATNGPAGGASGSAPAPPSAIQE
ncbi:hypothetical protein FRC18_002009 [Serendipita sp. 400]|nr:hypothetical protein FRC18_002009 [Serendipita sp. 400]